MYVKSVPAMTGSGLSAFVIAKSGPTTWIVVVVLALLSLASISSVALVTVAVFKMLPVAPGSTCTTISMMAGCDKAGKLVVEAVTVPVLPCAGVLRVSAGPKICWAEKKVVFVGTASLISRNWASLGPASVIEML